MLCALKPSRNSTTIALITNLLPSAQIQERFAAIAIQDQPVLSRLPDLRILPDIRRLQPAAVRRRPGDPMMDLLGIARKETAEILKVAILRAMGAAARN